MNVPHIPVLRLGRSYESLDKFEVKNHRTGELMATVSSVNAGIIRKDLSKVANARAALKKFTCAQLIELSAKAGEQATHRHERAGGRIVPERHIAFR
jgi:hypothetical protein